MIVWDAERDEMTEVTEQEARAGMMRYARSLGAGSAACAVWEERALGGLAETACTELDCPDCHAPAGKPCEVWCIADQAAAPAG